MSDIGEQREGGGSPHKLAFFTFLICTLKSGPQEGFVER